jgi:hypothetical protein
MTLTSLKQLPGALVVLALACSDSPPTPAQGAANLILITSGCSTGRTGWVLPDGASPTNETQVGDQIADGTNGATVSCRVTKSGSGFVINGSLETGDGSFSVIGSLQPGGLAFEGSGNISFYSSETTGMKGEGCTLSINAAQSDKSASGKVWGNFECASLKVTASAVAGCLAKGSFVFGNCAG